MKSCHLDPHSRFILQGTVIIAIRKIKTTAKIHIEISVKSGILVTAFVAVP